MGSDTIYSFRKSSNNGNNSRVCQIWVHMCTAGYNMSRTVEIHEYSRVYERN